MAVMTIRGLDDEVRDKLRRRAAEHGRSMEAEVRAILTDAVASPVERTLVDVLLQMREALGGLELEIPPRTDHARDPFA
jgi:plasmid stability protein